MVASGAQGVPVAVAWHTLTVAPATGWPAGPKTMSSLRDPCAAAGLATHAAHANPSIAARITFFVAPNLFFTLAMGFIPSSRLSQICVPFRFDSNSLPPPNERRNDHAILRFGLFGRRENDWLIASNHFTSGYPSPRCWPSGSI